METETLSNNMIRTSKAAFNTGSSSENEGTDRSRSASNQDPKHIKRQAKDIRNLQQMHYDADQVQKTTNLSDNLIKIASDKGFIISENRASGNCMFYALSEQLECAKGIKVSHQELRETLVQSLKETPNLPDGTNLFNFVDGYPTWSDYLSSMGKYGTWGDHLILRAAANCYKIPIRVISSLDHEVIINPDGLVFNTNPLVLGHIHECHYVSLLPKQETLSHQMIRMSKPANNTGSSSEYDNNSVPPELCVNLPSVSQISKTTKPSNDAPLPIDFLLLTVKDCEFLACYRQLEKPFRCWFDGVGFVYFEDEGTRQGKTVKVALMRCHEGSSGPGGSLITVKNAVTVLRPKGVISMGTCSGLNPEKTKLGDVVVSAKIATQSSGMRNYLSRHFLDLIKHARDGWEAPLKNMEAREVKVHCDGEFLSGPEQVSARRRREELAKSYPQATAIEMEGEGLFTAAFDLQVEWLVVKGVCNYADGSESTTDNWSHFASAMSASVVANILNDPVVFERWPHYEGSLQADAHVSVPRTEMPGPSCSGAQAFQQSHAIFTEHAAVSAEKQSLFNQLKHGSTSASTPEPKRIKLQENQSPSNQSKRGAWCAKQQNPKRTKRREKQSTSRQSKRGARCAKNQDPKDSATKQFLEWCQEQLYTFYNMCQVKLTPWDPDNTVDIDKIYIPLSMLRDDRKPHETTKEKLDDYSEMFESHGPHRIPNRIVVYGRPGIGKSTFAQKIAVDWTRGGKEILKRFNVLLLIKLRDVCDTQDFCSMLKTAKLLSAEAPMAVNNLYEYVRQNQEKVLIVLDGYDEYSAGKSSPVHQIWRGSQLRGCCVVITTRPIKEDELRGLSHVQVELNGFDTMEQIKQFASKLLSGQKDVEELVEYLYKQHLLDMAEIPLLLLMLCLVWKEKDSKGLPTSRADLFTSFMQTLMDHLAAKDSDEAYQSIDEYKEELSKLGELAFYALLEDCLHFNFSKLPNGDVFKKFIEVGFFQTSKLSSLRPQKIVYFLHKSVQEFLAAWFIVQEVMRKENETVTCLLKVDSLKQMEKMTEVLKFVCELSSDAARAVLSHLQMIGEKEGLTAYNFTKTPSVEDMSFDQRRFISISSDCLFCCSASDRQDMFPLFLKCVNYVVMLNQDQIRIVAREHLLKSTSSFPSYVFFILSNPKHVCSCMAEHILSIMRDLNIDVVSCSEKVRTIFFCDIFLKKEEQQMFFYLTWIRRHYEHHALPTELLTELTSVPVSSPQKSVDDPSKNQDNSSTLVLAENVPVQTQKHCLSLVRKITIDGATSEDLVVVKNVLPFVTSPRIIKIYDFDSRSYDAGLIESMTSNIHFTDNLHSLILKEINLTATCATYIATSLLHQGPNLYKLDLSLNPLYSGVSDLAENLHHVPQLTELKLDQVHMGEKECTVLATSLQYVNKLQVLYISDNPLGHGIIELAKHLNCVPELTELKLVKTQMGDEEATAVARCLQSIPLLKKLELSRNPLGRGIIELAKHLNCVSQLTWLRLAKTQMGEEEVSALARALKYVPELEWLELASNPLGRRVSVLIQHFSSVPQLKILYLQGVEMKKKEAEELCSAVRGSNITMLNTDYHIKDEKSRVYQVCTEAELKLGGGWWRHDVPITFDGE